MSKLLQYAQQCYETAAEKGFWDDKPTKSKGEMVMLMVSELGECLEAHRKGLIASRNFAPPHGDQMIKHWMAAATDDLGWLSSFKARVKDTVEDELADVVIRILNYTYGWDIKVIEREYRKESTGNFGHDLLRINWHILGAYRHEVEKDAEFEGRDWGYVLAAIEKFAWWYNVNLEQHVIWKMRYNSTREKMHGKAY